MQFTVASKERDRDGAQIGAARNSVEAVYRRARLDTVAASLLELQRTHGNRHVQRLLGLRSAVLERGSGCGGACSQGGGACATCAEEQQRAPSQSHHRCHANGECPGDDPEALYQGSGSTICNTATGVPSTTVTEHCAGNCVAQHEGTHANDIRQCCANRKACLDAAGADATKKAACNDTYIAWIQRIRDWTECNAYTTEVTCLTSLISNGCGAGSAAAIPAACCTTLRSELATATSRKTTHCAAAATSPCPIRADGTII
jgi:hypothetical protein